MDIKTQWDKILEYCRAHGSITVRECFEQLHINSPTKRLSEMASSGAYRVEKKTVSVYNEDGKYRTRITQYYVTEV